MLKKFFQELRDFAMRGNVLDMAVGVILGAAFGKIITSMVNDVLMPPIGRLLGKVDFSNLYINLTSVRYQSLAEAKAAGAPTVNYGLFLNEVINFIIVAAVIFMLVKQSNRLKKQAPPPAPSTRKCPFCLSDIPLKATRCAHCTSEIKPEVLV